MAFGKKKDQPKEKEYSFEHWESDFGFLNLILSRKKGISKEFLIKTYSQQKQENALVSDEEIAPAIENIINEVINNIGDKYKTFLIDKYFGTFENLVSYITEDVYVDILSETINENASKVKRQIQNKVLENIQKNMQI